MLNKENERGLCPFTMFDPCNEKCVFYRKGVRFNELKDESYPFEDCAINVISDNLEAMHQRTYAMQKEVGETKSVMAMKILSDLGKMQPEKAAANAVRILDQMETKKLSQ